MKRRTREILACVLAGSVLLGTPACTRAAEAVAVQRRTDWERQAAVSTDPQAEACGGETGSVPKDRTGALTSERISSESASESASEIMSETTSETASESASEDASETISETLPEKTSEKTSESASEKTSEDASEIISEARSADTSETASYRSETEPGSMTEACPETQEEAEKDSAQDEWVELPASRFTPEISAEGDLDYRTYVDRADELMIPVRRSEIEQDIPLRIKLKDSPLHDSDFYIELSKDGQVQQYGYAEWIRYLEGCHGWVNGETAVKLSDTGRNYCDSIRVREQESGADSGQRTYTVWAERSGVNADTSNAENGTRTYTLGRDTQKPVLTELRADNQCYEPAGTDTEQYFPQDFVLSGTFCDDASGVQRIEYTADIRAGEDSVWIEIETADTQRAEAACEVDFEIALTDGCYPALAVRAHDRAGNVSDVRRYAGDAGGYSSVVVDSTAPVLQFDVTADGQPYSGETDNWTNKDVRIEVAPAKDTCPYAGIYRYEYVYMKIGETMADVSDKWTVLPAQDSSPAVLTVAEDRNGYYLFRAISRSGVETAADAGQRILIQHRAAGIKPVIVSGADEEKRKNGWYNKQSGTPQIRFAYPDYDTGVLSGEYDAPITLHYELFRSDFVPDMQEPEPSTPDAVPDKTDSVPGAEITKNKAVIGVMSCADVTVNDDGRREFVLTRDDLDRHVVELGADDGFYTLRYWTTDNAGNQSQKQVHHYKVDCHEPTELTMELAGSAFEVGREPSVTYRRFYRDTVSGSAGAQYGISGKGSLTVSRVKRIGEWKNMGRDGSGDADTFSITPNTRCFLYIRAEDEAGNVTEGWTNGIAVDSMAPNESRGGDGKELTIAPVGANEHGFFNADIAVDIRVMDAPEDDNCSALQSVTSTVGRDGENTVAGQELFSFTKEAPTEDELTAASGFEGTQLIDAAANESNEAYIEVTATDRSGNTKTSTRLLKIDVTKPEVDIRIDRQDARNGNYYCREKTVTICVHERNFDPGAVSVAVTRNGETSEMVLTDWTSDGIEHCAAFTLAEDGEYSITAGCVDLADNASEVAVSETFVIDRTAPQIAVALDDGREAQSADREYFGTGVTAVITVTEHNFREEDVAVYMTPVSEKRTWSHDGDIHTLRISFEGDGFYHIECAYADMAGNAADTVMRSFIIDTSAPQIRIDGVADGSANSGAVLPVITVSDTNIELSDIALTVRTGIGDLVVNTVETAVIGEGDGTGYRLTLTDMTQQADNLYYLTVSARDKAGNEAERTCRFSLNRNGSVYDLSAFVRLMEKQYNTYDEIRDIQVIEMNVDTVEDFELYVSRNGAIGYEADYTSRRSGSADTGYTYIYQICKENFAEEGIYRISLYSRDRAGNEVNNTTEIHGEEIVFTIDNTAPRVVIDGVESGKVYDVETQQVRVVVTDNFKLTEAELTLVNKGGEVLGRWDYMELAGESEVLEITIPQCDEPLSLLYRVKDAAGNEMQTFQGEQTALGDFLVTTDQFVQLLNSPSQALPGSLPLLAPGAASLVLAAGLLHRKRRRA